VTRNDAERIADIVEAGEGPVTTEDLERFAATFADLADPDIMRRAWE
jgi:hypothetical protein